MLLIVLFDESVRVSLCNTKNYGTINQDFEGDVEMFTLSVL